MKFYHGGVKNLAIGDFILSPVVTGQSTLGQYVSDADAQKGHNLPNKVYITTDLNAARTYASVKPKGDVYVVQPIGDIGADIDAPEISFTCDKAVIVSVVQRNVKFKAKRLEGMMNW